MGVLEALVGPLVSRASEMSTAYLVGISLATFLAASIFLNVLSQILFKDKTAPPVVFHWVPIIGSTISYGMEPYKFFFECRKKYGDIFTFVLLGRKTTVFLGTKGNDFILNGKLSEVNAEEIYRPLTAPVFGKGVVYDCPNAKLMEQKKFVKFGLTTEAFKEYVPLIVKETMDFFANSKYFKDQDTGLLDVPPAMAELTIYTASRSLQGKEVRDKFDSTFADLYHDLDAGFQPINFMMPWFPLPQNRRRDHANRKMAETYLSIINERKAGGAKKDSEDMIWNLMQCKYRDGTPIPDQEVAHMMIALLMAGQHSSSTTACFSLLRMAANPEIQKELLEEQRRVLGPSLPDLTYENLQKLPLHNQIIRETLRMHAPIHSVMRQVTKPMVVEGTNYIIPTSHVLLAAPGFPSKLPEYFPNPDVWDPHRWDDNGKAAIEQADEEKIDYGYGLVSKGTNSPYLPFGAGRHRCIGEHFAYLQLTTILVTFVREVRIWADPDSGLAPKEIVGTDYSSLFSAPLRPAKVCWERRRSKENKSDEKA